MKEIDTDRIEKAVRELLIALGDDPDREGLIETPRRVADMYEEVFEGMRYTNDEIADMFNKCFTVDNDNLVVVRDIECFSYCEHHMALIYDLKVSVAYIPKGKVIGISKIARIADMVCKRLQIQERIGADIAEILRKILDTDDIAVIISGTHSCMTARGIKKTSASTLTNSLYGKFRTNSDLRAEVLSILN
ncbi:MAG: GTP cyclohydrolase I FolE [archaeon]|nr:GTP cyclohydrolase I FolE [archaeon]